MRSGRHARMYYVMTFMDGATFSFVSEECIPKSVSRNRADDLVGYIVQEACWSRQSIAVLFQCYHSAADRGFQKGRGGGAPMAVLM